MAGTLNDERGNSNQQSSEEAIGAKFFNSKYTLLYNVHHVLEC